MSNLGTISYTAEIETQKVLSGGAAVNKQLDNLQTGFNKTDKAAAGSSKSMTTLGNSMDTSGAKASKFSFALAPLAGAIAGVVSAQALVNLQKLGEQFTLLESRVKRLSASAEDALTNYAALLQISSAGGSDLTTTIKLWESLTASLTSLGVTRDQVLSLTDTLQKIGKIGGSSAEEISAALRQFSQAVAGGTLRAEEFNSIIEQMPELGRKIADGLGIPFNELRQQMLDGKLTIDRVLTAVYEQTGKVNAEFNNVPRTVDAATNAIVNAMGVAISKIDQATRASQTLAKALDAIARGIRLTTGDLNAQEQLATLMQKRVDIQTKLNDPMTGSATRKAAEKELGLITQQIKAIQDKRVEQQKAEGDALNIKTPENKEQTDSQKALDNLQKEAELTRLVGVERAKLQAKQKLGPTATGPEIEEAQRLAVEIYNLENARKQEGATNKKQKTEAEQLAKRAAAAEKKELEDTQAVYEKYGQALADVGKSSRDLAMDQAELELAQKKAIPTAADIQLVRDLAAAQFDATQGKSLVGQFDPIAGENANFDKQKADLEIANQVYINDQKLLSDQAYIAAKTQLETEHSEKIRVLEEQRFAAQSKGNALIISTLNQVQSAATSAFTGLITGASNGEQAVQALAGAILNEAVGAVVAFGFAQLKSLIIGQTVGTAATAAAVGQAGIAAAAWATPAALASLATLGGNAVPAGAALTGTVGIAQGLALGARQYGGPTSAGGMYRVNENGAPEIFNAANGRQYMMPNQRGEVVSNKDATSGADTAQAPIININNYSQGQASTSSKWSEADRRFIVDVIVGDAQANGRVGKTVNQITGTKRVGS